RPRRAAAAGKPGPAPAWRRARWPGPGAGTPVRARYGAVLLHLRRAAPSSFLPLGLPFEAIRPPRGSTRAIRAKQRGRLPGPLGVASLAVDQRRPVSLRAMTRRWISEVPS